MLVLYVCSHSARDSVGVPNRDRLCAGALVPLPVALAFVLTCLLHRPSIHRKTAEAMDNPPSHKQVGRPR